MDYGNRGDHTPPDQIAGMKQLAQQYPWIDIERAGIKTNKDFDLLMLPNQRHGYGDASNYMTRRRWDSFVKHLLNLDPPRSAN